MIRIREFMDLGWEIFLYGYDRIHICNPYAASVRYIFKTFQDIKCFKIALYKFE